MEDSEIRKRLTAAVATMAAVLFCASSMAFGGNLSLKAAINTISVNELKNHVTFLASDALEGREAGTTGAWAASKYIIEELKKVEELKPGDRDGDWLQYFNGNFRNILVSLPGSDPDLKNEIILIGAHYDHVGYGNRANSRGPVGFVHNGADDNASGTAALIEVLEALAELKPAPKRSILAVFWDGEEQGLTGSEFFVANPIIPLDRIRLTLNSDMVGRLGKNGLSLHGWRTANGFRQFLAQSNTVGLNLNFSWDYRRDSDHWPFFEHNIPSVMLHTGKHSDYHRPSDDVNKVNFEGTQRIAHYLFQLTLMACNLDGLPEFRPESRPEVARLSQLHDRYSAIIKRPSRLGVSYNSDVADKQKRIFVTRVEQDSPAAEARIKPDDEILQLGDFEVSKVPDFRVLVVTTPKQTTVRFKRDGEERTAKLALRGSPVRYGFEWRIDPVEPDSVIVTHVMPGSPAHLAGLKKGHRILKIGDETPSDRDGFRKQLSAAKGTVKFEVEHSGQFTVLNLQKFPPD